MKNKIQSFISFLVENRFETQIDSEPKVILYNGEIYITIVDQGYDGIEVWMNNQRGLGGIRFDFILEYLLTKNVHISKVLKSKLESTSSPDTKNNLRLLFNKDFFENYYLLIVKDFDRM